MVAKSFLAVLSFVALFSDPVFPQPNLLKQNPTLSTFIVGAKGDSVTVCIAYNLSFSRMIFTKSSSTGSLYSAGLSFTVDALDSVTGINYHGISEKIVGAGTFAETRTTGKSFSDLVTLTLPISTFRVAVEVRDDSQGITYLRTSFQKDFAPRDSAGVIGILLLDSLSGRIYYPSVRENSAPFPSRVRFLILAKTGNPGPLSISVLQKGGTPAGVCEIVDSTHGYLQAASKGNSIYLFEIADSSYSLYLAELPVDSLSEGVYELKVMRGKSVSVYPLKYYWADKPLTLRDIPLAVSLLKYIAPDSVYSEINSGSAEETKSKFDAFWKSHDPTPTTAFNELEAEFYRRADYAFGEFRSVGNRNGAATDRGKAYILFGAPDSIKRDYRSDGTYEIWTYITLKRNLVFKEQGFGEFKLYQTEQL